MPQYPCLVCGKPSPGSYCSEHQREVNADVRNSRAWRRLSETVRAREPHCRDCKAEGKTRLATQVHHVKPRGQGGELLPRLEDLVPLCTSHHNQRRKAEAGGWLPPGDVEARNLTGRPEKVTSWPFIA